MEVAFQRSTLGQPALQTRDTTTANVAVEQFATWQGGIGYALDRLTVEAAKCTPYYIDRPVTDRIPTFNRPVNFGVDLRGLNEEISLPDYYSTEDFAPDHMVFSSSSHGSGVSIFGVIKGEPNMVRVGMPTLSDGYVSKIKVQRSVLGIDTRDIRLYGGLFVRATNDVLRLNRFKDYIHFITSGGTYRFEYFIKQRSIEILTYLDTFLRSPSLLSRLTVSNLTELMEEDIKHIRQGLIERSRSSRRED